MDSTEARLVRCFQTVFPDLQTGGVPEATVDSVPGWDSVATVTLINVVEEEFGLEIGLEDVERMVSFPEFLEYLRSRQSFAAAG